MPGKQLLHLLAIVATFSTLTFHFNHRSALAMSAKEVSQQQRRQETAQAISDSWLPRCVAAFIIGGYTIYNRKKQLK